MAQSKRGRVRIITGPKSLRSADGINVRIGERYYMLKIGAKSFSWTVVEKVLATYGRYSTLDMGTLKISEEVDDQRPRFAAKAEHCFHDPASACREAGRRMRKRAAELIAEAEAIEAQATEGGAV